VLASQIKDFLKRILQQGKRFLTNSFFRVKDFGKHLWSRFRSWPRLWRMGLLYLLVVLLTGSIYLWRTAQLRTINPYSEKINFGELKDEELPDKSSINVEQNRSEEPASAEPADPEEHALANKAPEPPLGWPVEGRIVIFGYGNSTREVLARLDEAVKWSYSKGLGIKAASGEEVRSITGGKVKKINKRGKPYGKEVIIEHNNNLTVYYGALEQVHVEEGAQVAGGDPIATVKQNPEGKETYLYLEIEKNGRPVDPLDILPCS